MASLVGGFGAVEASRGVKRRGSDGTFTGLVRFAGSTGPVGRVKGCWASFWRLVGGACLLNFSGRGAEGFFSVCARLPASLLRRRLIGLLSI